MSAAEVRRQGVIGEVWQAAGSVGQKRAQRTESCSKRLLFALSSPYTVGCLAIKGVAIEAVRCPVHGFIEYSREERQILDHALVQRLRYIHQLGLTYLVYPGAVHTRFEHSLGVMELVTRAYDGVVRDCGSDVEHELAGIRTLRRNPLERGRQVLRLAALLHDVGHPPFSHAAEKALRIDHEKVAADLIRAELREQINSLYFQGAAELVADLIERPEAAPFLRQFIIGEMDMDRTDYLRRDALHCGVDYGVFDFRRLLECLTVCRDPDTGRLLLAIRRGGEHTFEALILARYQMSTQVYLHKIRRVYDHYLAKYLEHWVKAGKEGVRKRLFQLSDDDVLAHMRSDRNQQRSVLARRILERRHHRLVHDSGDAADASHLKKAKLILRDLEQRFPQAEFILDDCPLTIHKLWTPGDQSQPVEDLYIVDQGTRRRLTEFSAVISAIPKQVRTVRIFADAQSESELDAIRQAAKDLEKEP